MKLISLPYLGLVVVIGCVTIPPLLKSQDLAAMLSQLQRSAQLKVAASIPQLPQPVHTVEVLGKITDRPVVMQMRYTNVTTTHLTVDVSDNLSTWTQGPSFDASTNNITVIDFDSFETPARFFRLRKTL